MKVHTICKQMRDGEIVRNKDLVLNCIDTIWDLRTYLNIFAFDDIEKDECGEYDPLNLVDEAIEKLGAVDLTHQDRDVCWVDGELLYMNEDADFCGDWYGIVECTIEDAKCDEVPIGFIGDGEYEGPMLFARFRITDVYVGGYDIKNRIDKKFDITIPCLTGMLITDDELNDYAFQCLSDALDEHYKDVVDFEWELIGIDPITK